jgi:hypothetical protein
VADQINEKKRENEQLMRLVYISQNLIGNLDALKVHVVGLQKPQPPDPCFFLQTTQGRR